VCANDDRKLLPLHDRVRGWLRDMLRHERANLYMGFDLHTALSAAGFTVERVRAEANVLTPVSDYPIATIVRAVLPRLVTPGITTEREIDVDTLDARLSAERQQAGATCLLGSRVLRVWAQTGRVTGNPGTPTLARSNVSAIAPCGPSRARGDAGTASA